MTKEEIFKLGVAQKSFKRDVKAKKAKAKADKEAAEKDKGYRRYCFIGRRSTGTCQTE